MCVYVCVCAHMGIMCTSTPKWLLFSTFLSDAVLPSSSVYCIYLCLMLKFIVFSLHCLTKHNLSTLVFGGSSQPLFAN